MFAPVQVDPTGKMTFLCEFDVSKVKKLKAGEVITSYQINYKYLTSFVQLSANSCRHSVFVKLHISLFSKVVNGEAGQVDNLYFEMITDRLNHGLPVDCKVSTDSFSSTEFKSSTLPYDLHLINGHFYDKWMKNEPKIVCKLVTPFTMAVQPALFQF